MLKFDITVPWLDLDLKYDQPLTVVSSWKVVFRTGKNAIVMEVSRLF